MNNQNKKNKMPRFNLNWLYIAIIAGLVSLPWKSINTNPAMTVSAG